MTELVSVFESRLSNETSLEKVVIRRQRLSELEVAHQDKARAVGEGKIFVAVAEKERACLVQMAWPDVFPSYPRAAINLPPPGFGGINAQTKPKQRERLVHHIIARQKYASSRKP